MYPSDFDKGLVRITEKLEKAKLSQLVWSIINNYLAALRQLNVFNQ